MAALLNRPTISLKPEMMTKETILMCVLDCLQDDDIESVLTILNMLNGDDKRSWQSARSGIAFTSGEVESALRVAMKQGFVTPCARTEGDDLCQPVSSHLVGTTLSWKEIWFHLEPAGRKNIVNGGNYLANTTTYNK